MSYQFDFYSVLDYAEVLQQGILMTIRLTVIGAGAGVALGIFGAWART